MKKIAALILILLLLCGCSGAIDRPYYHELLPLVEDTLTEYGKEVTAADQFKTADIFSRIVTDYHELLKGSFGYETDDEKYGDYGPDAIIQIIILNLAMHGRSSFDHQVVSVRIASQDRSFQEEELQQEIRDYFRIVPADYDFNRLTDKATVTVRITPTAADDAEPCDVRMEYLYEYGTWKLFRCQVHRMKCAKPDQRAFLRLSGCW